MSKLRVALALVSALTFTAHLAAADDAPEGKDRATAFWLSGGGTAVSIGLMLAGAGTHHATLSRTGALSLLVTPAAGEIYAGKVFTTGMGIRLASLGVGVIGVAALASCSFPLVEAGNCHDGGSSGATLLALAALGYTSGIVVDIATAGSAVDNYNERLRLRVTPTVIPTASSGPAVGLGITGSF